MQQKDYSEETAKKIDEEVRHLVNHAYTRAKKLLTENRDKLDKMAVQIVNNLQSPVTPVPCICCFQITKALFLCNNMQ